MQTAHGSAHHKRTFLTIRTRDTLKAIALVGCLFALISFPIVRLGLSFAEDDVSARRGRIAQAREVAALLGPGAGAICRDHWISASVGSGTCSHHGGVMKWAADVYQQASSPDPVPVNQRLVMTLWAVLALGVMATAGMRAAKRSAGHVHGTKRSAA